MKFGQRLNDLMIVQQVSAYRLSIDLGVHATTVSNWRNSKTVPSGEKIEEIAEYFGVSADYLFGWEESDDVVTTRDLYFNVYTNQINELTQVINERGLEKVTTYMEDLAQIPEYQREAPVEPKDKD